MSRVFVIYDNAVETFARKICGGMDVCAWFGLDVGEQNKSLQSVERICSWLLSHKAERHCRLVAVGGGVTSDIVGFVAAVYKRGVAYELYPTTLLSQVDAAFGGKTGVNLQGVKNAVGAFKSPVKVHVLSEPLRTLPHREVLSGLAEMLKTFLIASERQYKKAVEVFSSPDFDICCDEVHSLVLKAGRIKRRIVGRDPFELKGQRIRLNLGHTVGHAITTRQLLQGEEILSHGQSVAIGIIRAAQISQRLGLAREGLSERLERDFSRLGLPTELPCPVRDLLPAIGNDKKMGEDGLVCFVLLRRIGKTVIKRIKIEEI